MNVHQKPQAGILLEVDLSVRPESYYYYSNFASVAWGLEFRQRLPLCVS